MQSLLIISKSKDLLSSISTTIQLDSNISAQIKDLYLEQISPNEYLQNISSVSDKFSSVILDCRNLSLSKIEQIFSILHFEKMVPVLLIADEEKQGIIPEDIFLAARNILPLNLISQLEIAKLVADGNTRLKLQANLEQKQELEKLISDIACGLSEPINHLDPYDLPLFKAIGEICNSLGAVEGRCYLFSEDLESFALFERWNSNLKEPERGTSEYNSALSFPWMIEQIKSSKNVVVNNPNDLPSFAEHEKRALKSEGFYASIHLPLLLKGDVYGFFTLYFREAPPQVTDELNNSFEKISTILANRCHRQEAWKDLNGRIVRLKKEVRESEDKFFYVLDSFLEPLIVADQKGRLIFANSAMTILTGFEVNEMIGRKLYQIFYPSNLREKNPEVQAEYERYTLEMEKLYRRRLQGISEIYTTRLFRKDGQFRVTETRGAPLKTKHGEIVGSIAFFVDKEEADNREESNFLVAKTKLLQLAFEKIAGELSTDLSQIKVGIELLQQNLQLPDSVHQALNSFLLPLGKAIQADEQLSMLIDEHEAGESMIETDFVEFFDNNVDLIKDSLGDSTSIKTDFHSTSLKLEIHQGDLLSILLIMALAVGKSEKYYFWSDVFEQVEESQHTLNLDPGSYIVIGVKSSGSVTTEQGYRITADLLPTLSYMVKKNSGKIVEEERDNHSKTIRIYLPASLTKANSLEDELLDLSDEDSEQDDKYVVNLS